MKEYPIIHKDPWKLDLFEHTVIEIDENISYQLMRVMGGWLWCDIAFIPYSEASDIDRIFLNKK